MKLISIVSLCADEGRLIINTKIIKKAFENILFIITVIILIIRKRNSNTSFRIFSVYAEVKIF